MSLLPNTLLPSPWVCLPPTQLSVTGSSRSSPRTESGVNAPLLGSAADASGCSVLSSPRGTEAEAIQAPSCSPPVHESLTPEPGHHSRCWVNIPTRKNQQCPQEAPGPLGGQTSRDTQSGQAGRGRRPAPSSTGPKSDLAALAPPCLPCGRGLTCQPATGAQSCCQLRQSGLPALRAASPWCGGGVGPAGLQSFHPTPRTRSVGHLAVDTRHTRGKRGPLRDPPRSTGQAAFSRVSLRCPPADFHPGKSSLGGTHRNRGNTRRGGPGADGWQGRPAPWEPRLSGGVTTVTRMCRTSRSTQSPLDRPGPSLSRTVSSDSIALTPLGRLEAGR